MEIKDLIEEESLEAMEKRLGTVGDFTEEFSFLSGKGNVERNYILERDFGLVIDDTGIVRDCQTGEVIDEVKIYND